MNWHKLKLKKTDIHISVVCIAVMCEKGNTYKIGLTQYLVNLIYLILLGDSALLIFTQLRFRLGRARAGGLIIDPEVARNEGEFFDAICRCDSETLSAFKDDRSKTSSFSCDNWDFIKRCAKAVASTGNVDILKIVVNIFIGESAKPTEIGEIFALETIASGKPTMVTGLLQNWVVTRTHFVSNI